MTSFMPTSLAGAALESRGHLSSSNSGRQANGIAETHSLNTASISHQAPAAAAVEPVVVEALYPYAGDDQNHLHFAKGDIVEVWGREASGWWDGILIKSKSHQRGARGWFPSSEQHKDANRLDGVSHIFGPSAETSEDMSNELLCTASLDYVKPLSATEAALLLPETHRAPSILHRLVSAQLSRVESAEATSAAPDQQNSGRTSDIVGGTSLDILLGRRGADIGISDLEQILEWSPSARDAQREPTEDLTSFSSGGDIFGEIAAAAAADHQRDVSGDDGRLNLAGNNQSFTIPQSGFVGGAEDPAQSVLLPPHDVHESTSLTPTLPTDLSSASQNSIMDPDWVPKVSPDGRIFYYNTRTGQNAYDLPSPSTSSTASRQMWSETGTAASDKSKWTSYGTSVADYVSQEADRGRNSSPHARKASHNNDEGMARISTQSQSTDSSTGNGYSTPYRTASRTSTRHESVYTTRSSPHSIKSVTADTLSTPRKASIASQRSIGTLASSKRLSAIKSRKLEATLSATQSTSLPILAHLERQCGLALSRLSAAVQSRSEVYDRRVSSDTVSFQVQESLCRDELVAAADEVNNATRRMLSVTDVILEQPQHPTHPIRPSATSSRSLPRRLQNENSRQSQASIQRVPSLPIVDFRPLAMKITATESKLMLSVRTAWGLLATSPGEEASMEAIQRADNCTEEETMSLHRQQNIQLAFRKDIDTKLRFDLLVQIRTLSDAIAMFVEQIEAFSAKSGCTVTKNGLQLAVPAEAEASLSPEDILLPAASIAGNMRGHGFEHYYPKDKIRREASHPAQHSNGKPVGRARRVLSASLLHDLFTDRKALLDDLSALRTIIRTVIGLQEPSSTITPGLVPTVSTQILSFVNRLGRFLNQIEDIDIATRLDIDLDDRDACPTIQAADSSAEDREYLTSLKQARSKLREFAQCKSMLYRIISGALLSTQRLTMPSTYGYRPPTLATSAQPKDGSPLGCCAGLSMQPTTISQNIMDLLTEVEPSIDQLFYRLSDLNSIADQQSRVPPALRRLNAETRLRGVQDDDAAEELEEAESGTGRSISSTLYTAGQRISIGPSNTALEQLASRQSIQSFKNGREHEQRTSRSNSLTESLHSDISRFSAYAKNVPDDPRTTMLDVNLKDSPSSHSPSKSKLRQFFGDDAPGEILRRPTQASREIPLYLQHDYHHAEITFATDSSVKAGTLHALVCRLTNHLSADSQYNNAFLMTYRTFTDSDELLERLKARYYLQPPEGLTKEEYLTWIEQKQKLVRVRVINVIRSWLIDHLYGDDESGLLDRISAFAVTLPNESSQQIARIIERRRATGAPRRMTASISGGLMPPPNVPRNMKKIKFLDVDPLEIARQFTIMDSKLFAKITVDECLAKAWPKKFGNKPTPNFTAIADLSNAVTIWVAMSIVTQSDVRRRMNIIKHFIAIADKCRQLSNFTTLMHIVAGLGSSAIYRLKRSWELVNQRPMATFTFLGNLMSPENNHALYRDALRLVGSPCVPFLGVYFTDWVMSGEANSDMLRDKPDQINFAKRAKVAESIAQIQLHQATPYNLTPVPQIQTWLQGELDKAVKLAEDPSSKDLMSKAYAMSLVIEPREREDERIARLLSESGFL